MANLVAVVESGVTVTRELTPGYEYLFADKQTTILKYGTEFEKAQIGLSWEVALLKDTFSVVDIGNVTDVNGESVNLVRLKVLRIEAFRDNVAPIEIDSSQFKEAFVGTLVLEPGESVLFVNALSEGWSFPDGSELIFANTSQVRGALCRVSIVGY